MRNEHQYLGLLSSILSNGHKTDDRTGVGTRSVFGRQLHYNLHNGFPLLTTKKVFWKGLVVELLWMLRGDTNLAFLHKHGVKIWDSWADENGDLGPVYGKQMRSWNDEFDQIKWVIDEIKTNPTSRRLIVSLWNVGQLDKMKLPPCPIMIQFKVYGDQLHAHLYQRSADMFLGVPFDMASFSLLTHLIANECGLTAASLTHSFGDAHIYNNHSDQAYEQLQRACYHAPTLKIDIAPGELLNFIDKCDIMSWESISQLIQLRDYVHHPAIKAQVAV